jgi:RHS repeat-associated protein
VYTYDSLSRKTFAGFGNPAGPVYESTITYNYDAGNRLSSVVDSVTGTITPTFDGLDRLTSEVSPQGTVSYAYDTAGRRTSQTVTGQTEIDYTYDNANRVTQIARGSATVSFAYDNGNRRTSLTLPNGIVMSYSYDNGSELSGITYTNGGTTLGTLTYGYDLAGRRASMGGSYAQTGLPLPVSTTSYNANNQLTQWGSASLYYDANGNMTSDGVNSLNWNARNQLSSLDYGLVSFQYDAYGRRSGKSVAGVTTSYLYDGANVAQEISGGSVTANLLSGGIDEVFTRTDSAGAANFLTDALGSTVALTNSSGSSLAQYAYEPFGNTTITSGSSANSYEYTGRENDGTGLQFNRARYYNPSLQRFVSEDPMGFRGGDINLYAYVGNSSPNGVDPDGTSNSFVHKKETYNAALAAGYDEAMATIIADGVVQVDFRPGYQGTDAAHTHAHAMGGTSGRKDGKPESCRDAYAGAVDNLAKDMESDDETGAVHEIQDSYAGGHQYSPWDGGYWGIPGWSHDTADAHYIPAAVAASTAYLDAYRRHKPYASPETYLAPRPANCK